MTNFCRFSLRLVSINLWSLEGSQLLSKEGDDLFDVSCCLHNVIPRHTVLSIVATFFTCHATFNLRTKITP